MTNNNYVLSLSFRHYGSRYFNMSKWNNVKNSKHGIMRFKPYGGLWASPIGKRFITWEDFIKTDYPDYEGRREYFDFSLIPTANVFVIRSKGDLDRLTSRYGIIEKDDENKYIPSNPLLTFAFETGFDYEKMIKDKIDAVYFEISSYPDLYHLLYGMDVDSIIILNPHCIIERETIKKQ